MTMHRFKDRSVGSLAAAVLVALILLGLPGKSAFAEDADADWVNGQQILLNGDASV